MKRALIVCPGRGSYDRASLGQLQQRSSHVQSFLALCDNERVQHGQPTITEIDGASVYKSSQHVAGEHASLLTFACSFADYLDIKNNVEVVGVTGNSMGWYTALAVSGALTVEQSVELVNTMALYQKGNTIGGQLLLPYCDDDWQPSAKKRSAINATLAAARKAGHVAMWSIDLGGYAVLGADKGGLAFLMEHLPKEVKGARTFPLRLPLHSAFHTELLKPTSQRAQAELTHLAFEPPQIPLIDGRGFVFRPRHANVQQMASYTLGHQVYKPYDFTAAVRSAVRHTCPDLVIALGPGNALGGPLARILTWEKYKDLSTKAEFIGASKEQATLFSLGVKEQRSQLLP